MADPDRSSIPVIEFVTTLMREKFPNLSSSRGSPFYQTFVRPMAALLQPFRDRMNVIKRNQSMRNYAVMSEDELDRIVANFMVDRLFGSRAYGVQRVYFEEIRAVNIDLTAAFLDDLDHRWRPTHPVSLTEIEMSANVVAETQEYYVDVPVVAEVDGEEYQAEAGQVNRVINVPGATRTTNLASYFSGKDPESNTDLYVRARESITNQDLVKEDGITAAIKANFPTVRAVKSLGFGSPKMTRDVVDAVISIDSVLRYSYCQKINLPLDENGEVSWYDADGNIIIAPIGGYVAAVADLTGVDFNAIRVSSSYDKTTLVSAQPGFRVRMYQGYNGDPDAGDFLVTRVESVPLAPGGTPVKILRLDRAFADPQISSWDPVADYEKYAFTMFGGASTRSFHVGGKIDTYIDSTADEEDYVIVSILPEISSGVSEVPVSDVDPGNGSLPLFESGKPFRLPVLNILKVEQVDYEDDAKVERELIPGIDYVLVRAEYRGRYTLAPTDVVVIKGFESDGITPKYTGRRIKITYTTNQDVPLIQMFVDDPANRDLGKDILVKPKATAIVDIELSYTGPLELASVRSILSQYIRDKGFAATINTSEIDALLTLFGATKVTHPIQLHLRRDLGNGITQSETSQDSLTAQEHEVFYPASTLSVIKLD